MSTPATAPWAPLHGLYKPVPGKFKDYIAIPKANGYQSLHTTLIGPFGTPVEVQIRTPEMNHVAESGVASHWLYKEDEKTLTELQHKTHSWLSGSLSCSPPRVTPASSSEHVKVDLFPGEVYAFTPKGKIFALPRGATVVDFAYAVHTDVGNRCVAGRINGELMPLRTELAQRRPDGDHHRRPRQPQSGLAQLRAYRQGPCADPPLPQERPAGRSLDPRRAPAQPGPAPPRPHPRPGQHRFAWDRLLRELTLAARKELMTDIGLGRRLPAIVARRLAEIRTPNRAAPAWSSPGPSGPS